MLRKLNLIKLYNDIVNFQVSDDEPAEEQRKTRLLNISSLVGLIIFSFFVLLTLSIGSPLAAFHNFLVGYGVFGTYFILLEYGKVIMARAMLFIILPIFGFLSLTYIYGDIAVEHFCFSILIMWFFIQERKIYFLLYIIFTVLVFSAAKLIIVYGEFDPQLQAIGRVGYYPNIFLSFLSSSFFIYAFKQEVYRGQESIINYSNRLEKAYMEEKHQHDKIKFLSKELNHRVKNNLQIISGLINLQREAAKDDSIKLALNEIENKIVSLAIVHKRLYKSDDNFFVSLKEFLEELIQYVLMSSSQRDNLSIDIRIDDLNIWMEDAIHIGLIVNELLMNSVKYGINTTTDSQLTIRVILLLDNRLLIVVRDSGNGFSENFDPNNEDSFGLEFVKTMSDEYNGEVKYYNDNGAVSEIILNIDTTHILNH